MCVFDLAHAAPATCSLAPAHKGKIDHYCRWLAENEFFISDMDRNWDYEPIKVGFAIAFPSRSAGEVASFNRAVMNIFDGRCHEMFHALCVHGAMGLHVGALPVGLHVGEWGHVVHAWALLNK